MSVYMAHCCKAPTLYVMLTSGTQMRFHVLSTLVNNGYNTTDDDKT